MRPRTAARRHTTPRGFTLVVSGGPDGVIGGDDDLSSRLAQ
jgi:hypothetical protein